MPVEHLPRSLAVRSNAANQLTHPAGAASRAAPATLAPGGLAGGVGPTMGGSNFAYYGPGSQALGAAALPSANQPGASNVFSLGGAAGPVPVMGQSLVPRGATLDPHHTTRARINLSNKELLPDYCGPATQTAAAVKQRDSIHSGHLHPRADPEAKSKTAAAGKQSAAGPASEAGRLQSAGSACLPNKQQPRAGRSQEASQPQPQQQAHPSSLVERQKQGPKQSRDDPCTCVRSNCQVRCKRQVSSRNQQHLGQSESQCQAPPQAQAQPQRLADSAPRCCGPEASGISANKAHSLAAAGQRLDRADSRGSKKDNNNNNKSKMSADSALSGSRRGELIATGDELCSNENVNHGGQVDMEAAGASSRPAPAGQTSRNDDDNNDKAHEAMQQTRRLAGNNGEPVGKPARPSGKASAAAGGLQVELSDGELEELDEPSNGDCSLCSTGCDRRNSSDRSTVL